MFIDPGKAIVQIFSFGEFVPIHFAADELYPSEFPALFLEGKDGVFEGREMGVESILDQLVRLLAELFQPREGFCFGG